jgi:hypothetical protein
VEVVHGLQNEHVETGAAVERRKHQEVLHHEDEHLLVVSVGWGRVGGEREAARWVRTGPLLLPEGHHLKESVAKRIVVAFAQLELAGEVVADLLFCPLNLRRKRVAVRGGWRFAVDTVNVTVAVEVRVCCHRAAPRGVGQQIGVDGGVVSPRWRSEEGAGTVAVGATRS